MGGNAPAGATFATFELAGGRSTRLRYGCSGRFGRLPKQRGQRLLFEGERKQTMKSKHRFFTFVTAAALAAGGFGLAGCKEDPAAKTGTADNRTTGEKVADAGKKASEKIGQGVDATTREATDAAAK